MSIVCFAISWQLALPVVRLRAVVSFPNKEVTLRIGLVWPFRESSLQRVGRRTSRSRPWGGALNRALRRAMLGLRRARLGRAMRSPGGREAWLRTWRDELAELERLRRSALGLGSEVQR